MDEEYLSSLSDAELDQILAQMEAEPNAPKANIAQNIPIVGPLFDPAYGPLSDLQKSDFNPTRLMRGAAGSVNQFLQGTLPVTDEIAATLRSPFTDLTWEQERQRQLNALRAYEEEFPKTADASFLAGALAPVKVISGGAKTALEAPGYIRSAVSGFGRGATAGGAYGFADADGGVLDRLAQALMPAAAGGSAGAILGLAGRAISGPSPVQKELQNVAKREAFSRDELSQAASRLDDPTFMGNIQDAMPQSLGIQKLAEEVRASGPAGRAAGRKLIERGDETGARVSKYLDDIAPAKPITEAGKELKKVAADFVDSINKKRWEIGNKWFGSLGDSPASAKVQAKVKSQAERLYKGDDFFKQAVKEARKSSRYKDLPLEDPRLLQRAKNYYNFAETEARARLGESGAINQRLQDITVSKNEVTSMLKQLFPGDFAKRSAGYAEEIQKVVGMRENPLLFFDALRKGNTRNAGSLLFRMRPEEITELKRALPKADLPKFEQLVRASLEDVAEGSTQTFLNRAMRQGEETGRLYKQLEAALGKGKAKPLIEKLKLESQMLRTSELAKNAAMPNRVQDAAASITGSYPSAFANLASNVIRAVRDNKPRLNAREVEQLANILTDNSAASAALKQLVAIEPTAAARLQAALPVLGGRYSADAFGGE